jgi:hypothetical protein
MNLTLPTHRQPLPMLHQSGERVGVRGRNSRWGLWLPLTLALSPQAGRGNTRGVRRKLGA